MSKAATLASVAVLCAAAAVFPHLARAQYPAKPVRIVVGYSPGGPADTIARTLGVRLSTHLGERVVVDNRPGAEGSIADAVVARSAPDGHTVLLQGTAIAMNVSLLPNLPFDPLKDLIPVTLVGDTTYLIVVNPSVPARTLAEYLALAKAKKGELFYAAPSSPSIFATVMLNTMAGVEMVRVPYKGAGAAIPALLAGDVQFMISSIGPLLPSVKAGKLRALAVTSPKRSALAPEVPTADEAGIPGYSCTTWYGLFVPSGTARGIVDRLNAETRKVLAEPEVKDLLFAQGFELAASSPEQFREFLRSEIAKWTKAVKASGVRAGN